MLNDKIKQEILELQKKYPEKRSALIPALHMAQEQLGYLPSEIQDDVAALFAITAPEVNGVVTFYDMFYEKPVGKCLVHVCKNLSCMLRGGDELLGDICAKLKVTPGNTTEDGKYTVIASECLGACDRAPMMIVGEDVFGPVNNSDLGAIFDVK